MKITKRYLMGNSIKFTYVFILLLLLGSCKKNRDISEFISTPPYETKVEYIKDTIKITAINPTGSTGGETVYKWVKKMEDTMLTTI